MSWDMEKYLLSIFSGVCIRQVIFGENMYDLLVGQVKLSIIFGCPKSMGYTSVLQLPSLNYYSFYTTT